MVVVQARGAASNRLRQGMLYLHKAFGLFLRLVAGIQGDGDTRPEHVRSQVFEQKGSHITRDAEQAANSKMYAACEQSLLCARFDSSR